MSESEADLPREEGEPVASNSDESDVTQGADDVEIVSDLVDSDALGLSVDERVRVADDRALRAQAELENFRTRIRRDVDQQLRFANFDLLRDLLPVVDNIGRALEAAEKTQDASTLLEGVKMVAKQLESVLNQHGCNQIDAIGKPFDPNFHEAISLLPSDEHPAQTVTAQTQAGFRLHDRVIRPSSVIISTGSAEEPQGE